MADVSIINPLAGCFVPQNFLASGTSDSKPSVVMEKDGVADKPATSVVQTGMSWVASFTSVPSGADWTLIASLNNDEAAESNITVLAPLIITIFPLMFPPEGPPPPFALAKGASKKQALAAAADDDPTLLVRINSDAAKSVVVTVFTVRGAKPKLVASGEATPPNQNTPDWVFVYTGSNFKPTDKFSVHVQAFNKNGKLLGQAIRRKKQG